MALPPTVIGRSTGAMTWVPLAMPSAPSVVVPPAVPVPLASGVPVRGVVPVLVLSPSTEMALPPTVIGRSTGTTAWVPLAAPSRPEVTGGSTAGDAESPLSSAGARSPAPASVSPTTETAFRSTVTGTRTETSA